MTFSKDDIMHIAYLARLKLAEGEIDEMRRHFNTILDYVEQLDELSGEPLEGIKDLRELRLREDEVGETLGRDDTLKNAPDVKNGLIVVPRVISEE